MPNELIQQAKIKGITLQSGGKAEYKVECETAFLYVYFRDERGKFDLDDEVTVTVTGKK